MEERLHRLLPGRPPPLLALPLPSAVCTRESPAGPLSASRCHSPPKGTLWSRCRENRPTNPESLSHILSTLPPGASNPPASPIHTVSLALWLPSHDSLPVSPQPLTSLIPGHPPPFSSISPSLIMGQPAGLPDPLPLPLHLPVVVSNEVQRRILRVHVCLPATPLRGQALQVYSFVPHPCPNHNKTLCSRVLRALPACVYSSELVCVSGRQLRDPIVSCAVCACPIQRSVPCACLSFQVVNACCRT